MINGLDAFLAQHNLIQTLPLSVLAETRIGIELDVYLRRLFTSQESNEPYVAALGGAPLALVSQIEQHLRTLERTRVKPVFVLSGLSPNRKQRPFTQDDPKARLRAMAWDAWENEDGEQMSDLLIRSASTEVNDVVRSVLRAFRHRNVEFLVAPYLAPAQLVSLERHPRGYLHSIYSSTTTLLFPGIDRLILSVDFAAGTFTYTSKQALITELGLRTHEEFLDLALLAGWDHGSTFPPLYDGTCGPVIDAPPPSAHVSSTAGHPTSPEHKPISLRLVADLVRQYRSGLNVCHNFAEHPLVRQRQYLDSFLKSKAMIKYSLVVRVEDGAVVPIDLATSPPVSVSNTGALVNGAAAPNGASPSLLNDVGNSSSEIPSDLNEAFSLRLPDEVFLHLSHGLISHHVHDWLASGFLLVSPPLDNGDTAEYRRFVREALVESPQSPSCVAIALASSVLHKNWSGRKVHAIYWHSPHQEKIIPYDSKTTQQLISRVDLWNVPGSFIDEELRRQNSSTIDITLCLAATGSNELARRTMTPKRSALPDPRQPQQQQVRPQLEKKDEIVANVIWRMLELRGFLNHDHLHTPHARALHLALKASRLNDKLQEPLYLTLELIRAGALHGNKYTSAGRSATTTGGAGSDTPPAGEQMAYSGGPTETDSPHNDRCMLLVMRCFSLLPLQFKADAWNAPVSRELLVFNSFARSLGRSMRHLVEMIASTMLLRKDARRGRDDYLDIALSLPFQHDANTCMGIIFRCWAEALTAFCNGKVPVASERNSSDAVWARDESLKMLEEAFSNVRSVRGELERAFRFWECVMIAVRQLEEGRSISHDVLQDFRKADEWVKGFAP